MSTVQVERVISMFYYRRAARTLARQSYPGHPLLVSLKRDEHFLNMDFETCVLKVIALCTRA